MTERFATELSVTPSAGIVAYRPSMKAQLLVGAATLALIAPEAVAQSAPKWDAHIDVGGRFGSDRQAGEVEVFVPLWQDQDALLFGNIRGKFGSQGDIEGNFGLGYRTKVDGAWILGVNGFLDVTETPNNNVFYQGGIGLEALTEDFDFRVNGYFPGGDPKAAPGGAITVVGPTIQLLAGTEQALWGFDGEVGWRLPLGGEDTEVRVFGGGFYFTADGAPVVAGPQGRVEVRLHDLDFLGANSRVELGGGVSHDDIRDTRGYGSIRLRIPLQVIGDGTRLTGLDRRMTDRVVRDFDIVTGAGYGNGEDVFVEDLQNSTGEFWRADGTGGGDGSYDDPSDVNFAVDNASPNAIIVLDGGNGGIDIGVNTIDLQDGQALIGGGQTVKLTGADTGTMVMWTPGGTKPTISGDTGTTVIYLAEDNFAGGLGIDASGFNFAIRGASPTNNFFIHNNMITGADSDAIKLSLLNPGSRGKITDNMITNSGGDGIYVDISVDAAGDGNSFDLLIDGNTVADSDNSGIHVYTNVEDGATFYETITITDNVVTRSNNEDATGEDGIEVYTLVNEIGTRLVQELTIADNEVDHAGRVGIWVRHGVINGATLDQDNTININGNSVTDSDGSGIVVSTVLDNSAYAVQTINILNNFVADSDRQGDQNRLINGPGLLSPQYAGFGIVVANEVREDSVLRQDNTVTISGNTVQSNDSSGIAVFNVVDGDDDNLHDGDYTTETIVQTLNITDNMVSGNGGDNVTFDFTWPGSIDLRVYNDDGITVVNIAAGTGLIDQADTVNITGNTITGNDGDGLRVHNVVDDASLLQTFNINNNSIAYNAGDGIHFDAEIEGSFDVEIEDSANSGFIRQDVTISGNTITANGGDQIDVEVDVEGHGAVNQYLRITDNTIMQGGEDTTGDGIEISIDVENWGSVKQTVTIDGNTITGDFDTGLEVGISLSQYATLTQTLTVSSNSISGADKGGYFYVSQSDDSVALLDWTFTDNTISGNDGDGIYIALSLSEDAFLKLTALFDGNTIVGNGDAGIYIEVYDASTYTTANLDLTFRNNLISDNGDSGIDIDIYTESGSGGTGMVTLTLDVTDNTIAENGGEGLELDFDVYRSDIQGGMGVVNFHVAGNTITGNDSGGIDFDFVVENDGSYNASLTVLGDFSNNVITSNGDGSGDGIYFNISIYDDGSVTAIVDFYGNVISGNADDGIDVSLDVYNDANLNGTFNFINNTIAENGDNGVEIYLDMNAGRGTATLSLMFRDNTINGNVNDGVYTYVYLGNYETVTLNATFMNNLISDNGDDGIDIHVGLDEDDETIHAFLTFMNNTIVENDDDGVAFYLSSYAGNGQSARITFTQNLITGNTDDGVYIDADWSNTFLVFGGGNTITGNGGFDIYANAGDEEGNQILTLLDAANTLGTVTYNGWTNVLP